MTRSSHWFPIPYVMASNMPPGRAALEVNVHESILLEFEEIASAPLAIEIRWTDGRCMQWREHDGKLWRPTLDGKGKTVEDVAAMQSAVIGSTAGRGRYVDYPLASIHGKPMMLGHERKSVLAWGGKVTLDGREGAVRRAQEFVDERMLLIGGVPHVQAPPPMWGLDVLDEFPAIRVAYRDRDDECQLRMPLQRRDDLEILARRAIDMLRETGTVGYKKDLSIESIEFDIHRGDYQVDHHEDLARALDFTLARVGDLPLSQFGGGFFDRVTAARNSRVDGLTYSQGVERLHDVIKALPSKTSIGALTDCMAMAALVNMASEFEEAPGADDVEALGMGLTP